MDHVGSTQDAQARAGACPQARAQARDPRSVTTSAEISTADGDVLATASPTNVYVSVDLTIRNLHGAALEARALGPGEQVRGMAACGVATGTALKSVVCAADPMVAIGRDGLTVTAPRAGRGLRRARTPAEAVERRSREGAGRGSRRGPLPLHREAPGVAHAGRGGHRDLERAVLGRGGHLAPDLGGAPGDVLGTRLGAEPHGAGALRRAEVGAADGDERAALAGGGLSLAI